LGTAIGPGGVLVASGQLLHPNRCVCDRVYCHF
jgi:hypothetical protein